MLAFPKKRGLRIDAILAGPELASRCCDVGVTGDCIALLQFGYAASVERTCDCWVELQRGGVIRDGIVELFQFQVSEAATVEIICIIWL